MRDSHGWEAGHLRQVGSAWRGGTLLLSAAGAAGGGGLGAFLGSHGDKAAKAQIGLETRKLRALIRLCTYEDRSAETKRTGREQQLVLEAELARLVDRRIALSLEKGAIETTLDAELREVAALRQFVAVDAFELKPR